MQESNRSDAPKQEGSEKRGTGGDDATSKETLDDLEKSEKVADSKSESAADRPPVPSPDGTPDTDRGGRADGSDTGGPM